jgi:hypothetical protein
MNELISKLFMKFPLASTAFLAYAIVGGVMLVSGTLDYGSYSATLLKVGIACGAIGIPRAVTKVALGHPSSNFLGVIESLPIPTLVFVTFTVASTIDLAIGGIVFGQFTSNLEEVGIACGIVQAARATEHVLTT